MRGPSRVLSLVLIVLVVLAAAPVAATAQPRVAAASSLNFALVDIANRFERERGERVQVVFGASGALTRQIEQGAPFELFLAADDEFPARLAGEGLTRDAGVDYAVGRLALFAPTGSPLHVDGTLAGLETLAAAGRVTRFAMANPEVAPYGKAAEAVLRRHGLWDRLRSALVFGDTVAQAAQFATTGNAVGGLIAYSLVKSPALEGRGTYALVPASEHEPLRHRMVMMKSAGSVTAHFYEYLQGPSARAILRQYGFEAPE